MVDPIYEKDSTSYLREHIAQLRRLEHQCDVTVVVATPELPYSPTLQSAVADLLHESKDVVTRVVHRDNNGMSYGCWNQVILETLEDYDFFILMEDDFVFLLDNFDDRLIELYRRLKPSFLCGNVSPGTFGTGHARHACGILSAAMAKKATTKRGRFEFLDKEHATPRDHEIYQTQKKFSSSIVVDTGSPVLDFGDHYQAGLRMKAGRTTWYGDGPRLLAPIQYLRPQHDKHRRIRPISYPTRKNVPVGKA